MSDITTNLGLTVWDLDSDPYDPDQLANNFYAIDAHDHGANGGAPITGTAFPDGSISGTKVSDSSITSAKIVDGTITGADIANGTITGANILNGTITGADMADGTITMGKLEANVLPVGTTILWYRPNGSVSLPSGWEILDGRAWSGIPNAWGVTTGNIPDMRNKFPLGAALSGTGSGVTDPPDIGQVGGAMTKSLAHSHAVTAHTHTVAGHTHTISSDGSHKHTYTAQVYDVNNNPTGSTYETDAHQRGSASPSYQGNRQSLYIPDVNRYEYYGEEVTVPMSNAGAHTHGGATGSTPLTTSSDASTTDSQLGTVDVRNAHVGFLYIMRVL